MDFVKNQIQRIQQQLVGLSASQKMLTAALVAIMVMTLLYWGRYAGTADMEPLLDQAFVGDDMARITAQLKGKGIAYAVEGDRVLVPAERKLEALADLAYARLLPRNTQTGFDQIAAKLSPWASASERAEYANRANEITCSNVISLFPDVEQAQVMIDPTKTRNIGSNIMPSATISLSMRSGAANLRQAAEAAALVVQGSQSGLAMSQINVVINGRPFRLRENDSLAGNAEDQFEVKQKHEHDQEQRILELLDDIQGLRVKVSVKLNTDRVETEEEKIDKDNAFSAPVEEETHETVAGGEAGAEPGAVPNVGAPDALANGAMEIGAGPGGGGGSRETMERTKFENHVPRKHIVTRSGPGEATVISASLRVPRSYFVNALKAINPDSIPDDKAVEAYAVAEMARITANVRASAGMAGDATVEVTKYVDVLPFGVAAGAAASPTATMSVPLMIGSHGKEIALGGLALVSLFMLMMMVKKSAPAPAVVQAAVAIGPPPPLVAGEAVAGEAGEGNALLDGLELDEDAVRTQQMLDQVTTMVKENPDAAASLVKRWLNRD